MNAERATLLFNESFDNIVDCVRDATSDIQQDEALEELWALIHGPLGPYASDKPACLRGLCDALEQP